MKSAIRFKGLTLNRDELATENGELALCGGVEINDGALRASVLKGEQRVNIGENKKLLYVHKLTDPDAPVVYVTLDSSDSKLYSVVGETMEEICALSDIGNKVTSIDAIGNTIIIIGDKVKYYALWKQDSNKYQFLGDRPPFLDMRFRVTGSENADYYDTDDVTITETSGYEGESSAAFGKLDISASTIIDTYKINEDYQSQVTDMIWAMVNKTNSSIAERNRFYAPFYVRYCYRLFDGSMFMHSAPVLMLTIEDTANQVLCLNRTSTIGDSGTAYIPLWGSTDKHSFSFQKFVAMYIPMNAALQYGIYDATVIAELKKWKDIISSVDVFISQPIYHYDTGTLIKSIINTNSGADGAPVYSADGLFADYNTFTKKVNSDTASSYYCKFDIPRYSEKNGDYTDISTFFKAYSFNVDDIEETAYKNLPMADGTVKTIVGREKMTDDYKSHNQLYANGQYIYNHRVNLYGLKEILFSGFYFKNIASSCTSATVTNYYVYDIKIKIETTEGTKIVLRDGNYMPVTSAFFSKVPLFYPDSRATEMRIKVTKPVGESSEDRVIILKMNAAAELNGAWTDVFSIADEVKSDSNWPDTTSAELDMSSKAYTSEANNPFYFPLEGINTIGTGDIMGLASTTRALSQGQFGQYPLLAFSTDGIWALSVSNTGTYSSIHPVSREVCENAESILQLDQSVLFATKRGLNRIIESDVTSLSGMLDGPYDSLVSTIAGGVIETTEQDYLDFNKEPRVFFLESKAIYDFVNARVLLFNTVDSTLTNIVMVLSLKDGTWSTMKIDSWKNVVNGYPYPYIQYSDGDIEELCSNYDYTDANKHNGVIVTRALSFEGLLNLIQGWEHVTESDAPKMVIYGSNELKTGWKKLGTSERMIADGVPGYPFKYFRVGMLLKMKTSQKYSHLILDVKEKYSHQ